MSHITSSNSKVASRRRAGKIVALTVALALALAMLMEARAIPGLDQAFSLARQVDLLARLTLKRAILPLATEIQLGSLRRAQAAGLTVYTVKSGDTLSDIAYQYGVSLNTVLQANGLNVSSIIRPGQKISIPSADGSMYTVQYGDSLWNIAVQYGSTVGAIKQANNLDSNIIHPGEKLVIPGGAGDGGTRVTIASANGSTAPSAASGAAPGATSGGTSTPAGAASTGAAWYGGAATGAATASYRYDALSPVTVGISTAGFMWPVYGALTSLYEWRWGRMHTGIDIAAPAGLNVRAAANGVVTFAGWLGGYGNAVMLRHSDGKQTLYGHASALVVKRGQEVEQGQVIARVGSTGNSTGPHLHFEVLVGGAYQNPLDYLAGPNYRTR